MLSIYGCFQHHKLCSVYNVCHEGVDAEQGSYVSLVRGEDVKGLKVEKYPDHQGKYYLFRTALGWGQLFQIMFQVSPLSVISDFCVIREQGDGTFSFFTSVFCLVLTSYQLVPE